MLFPELGDPRQVHEVTTAARLGIGTRGHHPIRSRHDKLELFPKQDALLTPECRQSDPVPWSGRRNEYSLPISEPCDAIATGCNCLDIDCFGQRRVGFHRGQEGDAKPRNHKHPFASRPRVPVISALRTDGPVSSRTYDISVL